MFFCLFLAANTANVADIRDKKNRCRLWRVVAHLPDTDPLPSVGTMQAGVGELSQVFK